MQKLKNTLYAFSRFGCTFVVPMYVSITSQKGFEPLTDGLAYHYDFHHKQIVICGLDYIFTISGATRIVSTEPHDNHLEIAFDYFLEFLPPSLFI